MNCSGFPPAGMFRAVASTVPPPRRKRSTTASPIPFVPPVTRIRSLVNSLASYGILDAFIIFDLLVLLRCEVVEENFLRKWQKHFLRGFLMDRVLPIAI